MNGDQELCDAQELLLRNYPLDNVVHLNTLGLGQPASWKWGDKKCPSPCFWPQTLCEWSGGKEDKGVYLGQFCKGVF